MGWGWGRGLPARARGTAHIFLARPPAVDRSVARSPFYVRSAIWARGAQRTGAQ
ncbi:hypothetical protein HMPREF1868_01962 [Olsenella sp. DNF00959]|nr:hypothetical protein HMPREF1868_01962 [Olsenella sp. DNF00959]